MDTLAASIGPSKKILIEPYSDHMFDEFTEIVQQGSLLKIDPNDPGHADSMRRCLTQENSILMAIRDAPTREFLGYCDVHNTDKTPWEIGIKLLNRHQGKGVGYAALSTFIPMVARCHNQDAFIARIAPDNLASIRLFQKLGASPREIKRSMYMLNDEMAERFAENHPELVDDTVMEMAVLFEVEANYLLGRDLIFNVPANPPNPECADLAGAPERPNQPAKKNEAEAFWAEELANDLISIRDLATENGDSEEFSNAFIKLKEKWSL